MKSLYDYVSEGAATGARFSIRGFDSSNHKHTLLNEPTKRHPLWTKDQIITLIETPQDKKFGTIRFSIDELGATWRGTSKARMLLVEPRNNEPTSTSNQRQTSALRESAGPKAIRPGIREEARRRAVDGIYHFTRIANLESILELGIVTRDKIDRGETKSAVNDNLRLEKCRKSVCCSIGFPNYKMFYKLRQEVSDAGGWVVLEIDEAVLWEKSCAFYPANAASKNFRDQYVAEFCSTQAFRVMFENSIDAPNRHLLELHQGWPTNPQAEVLVRSDIEREYIRGVYFENQKQAEKWSAYGDEYAIASRPDLFRQRHDHIYW